MIPKIIIASDSFKGCLTSEEVAAAVASGIREVLPDCRIIRIPMADGGEGTAKTLATSLDGSLIEVTVSGPSGRSTEASYGIFRSREGLTAVVESAQACGLTLLGTDELDPFETSTSGVGELILDAADKGCRNFIIGLGGSATNDGGSGMLEALGFVFRDDSGNIINGCCGRVLADIASIDDSMVSMKIRDSRFIAACDVNTPFYGKEGATRIFAPQKGADAETVERLEAGMKSFAEVIMTKYGTDLSGIPGSGAAGGLGGALMACLGAELKRGTDIVLDALGFDELIKDADLIITGEGKIDSQSRKGKVISGILERAGRHGIPVIAIAGMVEYESGSLEDMGFAAILPTGPAPQNESDLRHAMQPEVASGNISSAVSKALRELSPSLFRVSL